MRRTIRLLPAATVTNIGTGAGLSDMEPNGNPYGGAAQISLHDAWRDSNWDYLAEGGDCGFGGGYLGAGTIGCTYAYCAPHPTLDSGGIQTVSFEQPPTLVLFTRVKLVVTWDLAQLGSANEFKFPPANAFGPKLKLILRNRDGTTFSTNGFDEVGEFDGSVCNMSQPSCGIFYSGVRTREWEMTGHPEGGPFTLDDMQAGHFVAGVEYAMSGPAVTGFDFHRMRSFHFYAEVDVQDLGGYTRNVQNNSGHALRMFRKARNTIFLTYPAVEAPDQVHDLANISHPSGPGSQGKGWGDARLERRPTIVLSRTCWPEQLKYVDEHYDRHDLACNFWGAFRIPLAWTPELSGLSYLDLGGEYVYTRDQDGWSLPPGDGVALRVLPNSLNLSEDGLAIQGPDDIERVLQSSNPNAAPWTNAFTNVTVTNVEGTSMVNELGYLSSPKLVFGSMGSGGYSQDVGAVDSASGILLNARCRVRNLSVDDPVTKFLQFGIRRDYLIVLLPVTEWWNFATRAWQSGEVYAQIPSDKAFGEVIADAIPADVLLATTDPTYTVKVGRFTGTVSTATFVAALVSLQEGKAGLGTPLVTLGSTITRIASHFTLENVAPFTVWHRDRGLALVEFRPMFRADALAVGTKKTLLNADHTSSAYDRLWFEADTIDKIVFERFDASSSATVEVEVLDEAGAALKITRAHYLRVFCAWLDADGWREEAPRAIAVGVAVYLIDEDGGEPTFISYNENRSAGIVPNAETPDKVQFGRVGAADYLDGWFRNVEIRRNPLTGTEVVWRR